MIESEAWNVSLKLFKCHGEKSNFSDFVRRSWRKVKWLCHMLDCFRSALKARSPAAVLTRGTVRRLWSTKCSDRPGWYDKMSDARYEGWLVALTLKVNGAILKSIRDFVGSQYNCLSVSVMWVRCCRPVTMHARVFGTIWSFIMFLLVHRTVSSWRSPIEHWSANTLHFLLYLLLALVGCGVVLVNDSMSFCIQI